MPYDFAENESEPLTPSSSRRSAGPPQNPAGVGLLDTNEDDSAPTHPASGLTLFFILAVVAIMALIVFFLNR